MTGVSKYFQISQAGKPVATTIPWSLVIAFQAVKVEGNRKLEVPEVESHTICENFYLAFIQLDCTL